MMNVSNTRIEDTIIIVTILLLIGFLLYKHWPTRSIAPNSEEGLGIKDLVERVKSELAQVENERIETGQAALFEVNNFDLDVNFIVKTVIKGEGKIGYEFITVGGGTEISREKVHKISLHMTTIKPQSGEQPAEQIQPPPDVVTHGKIPPPSRK